MVIDINDTMMEQGRFMVMVNPWVSVCYDHIMNQFQVGRKEGITEILVTLNKCRLTGFLEPGMRCVARLPGGDFSRGSIQDVSVNSKKVRLVCTVSP